ncbi:hypothetical protein GALMADRAFT_146446 [Galerina marginata CBS 339.88]|uniref:Uncharacterized protein n=1 Tax=Galerina marginata (strain CBS 339.88) TaxID=685588 RepID=A0A067SDW3_GALM3|nr:hypothetical protein GALMADRAFT_146446 [Galerina marginata CBS 339.88]
MSHRPTISTGHSFVDVPAMFEPGAPPATRPVPIAQIEVGRTQTPNKLLAQEEIGPAPSRNGRSHVRYTPYVKDSPTRGGRSSNTRRSVTPSPNKAGKSRDVTPSGSDSSSSTSEISEDSDNEGLIPKPEGEAGRPGRGGYNFEEALAWTKKDFQKLKKFMNDLIDTHLDTSKKPSSQSQASVNTVRKQAVDKFPTLNNYEDVWPVMDLIRIRLKYSRGQARKADTVVSKVEKRSKKVHK